MALEKLRSQLQKAWPASGQLQKRVLADAKLTRGAFNNWVNGRRTPSIKALEKFAKAAGAQFVLEVIPKGGGFSISTTVEGAEAARLVDALPSPEVGRQQRELALRFLRVAHAVDDRGWDSLDLIIHHAETAIAAAATRKEG